MLARDMLRDSLDARDHFRNRYSHILIDEVQDTDPLQAELAMFLAEDVPDSADPSDRPDDWHRVRPARGKIFIVGDPKQSIYRFRRADIEQVKRLQQAVGGANVHLTQNFRSLSPVIEWVNHVFAQWMEESDGQPEYIPLDAEPGDGASPPVRYIGGEIGGVIGDVRRREANAIAHAIAAAVRDGWRVRDGDEVRPAAYRDVCILMPARTGLQTLELALEDADVPYRLETPSLVYATQEIQDLLNCLSAIDDPTDQVSRRCRASLPGLRLLRRRPAGVRRGGGESSTTLPKPRPRQGTHPRRLPFSRRSMTAGDGCPPPRSSRNSCGSGGSWSLRSTIRDLENDGDAIAS